MTVNTATPDYIVDGVLTDGEAWVALGTTTLSSGAVNIGFTSSTGANDWSQYMDLVLVSYLRSDETAGVSYLRVMVNSASTVTNGYQDQGLWGDGANPYAAKNTSTIQGIAGYIVADNATANIFGCAITTIFDINSGKHKTFTTQSAADCAGSGNVSVFTNTRRSQAPVTSVYVSLYPTGSDDLVAGSRVDLFGVLPRMVTA
jgi:hypothetical protein